MVNGIHFQNGNMTTKDDFMEAMRAFSWKTLHDESAITKAHDAIFAHESALQQRVKELETNIKSNDDYDQFWGLRLEEVKRERDKRIAELEAKCADLQHSKQSEIEHSQKLREENLMLKAKVAELEEAHKGRCKLHWDAEEKLEAFKAKVLDSCKMYVQWGCYEGDKPKIVDADTEDGFERIEQVFAVPCSEVLSEGE